MPLTDVVKNLLILNIVIYFVTSIFFPHLRDVLIFHYPTLEGFKPLQIVTYMFMHASDHGGTLLSIHLIFNMIALYFFGPPLEALWGPKRFLFYYLFTGIGSLVFHLTLTYFGIMSPGYLLIPPVSLKAKYAILIFALMELFLGKSSLETGIAHFAHLGGAAFGFLLLVYWDKYGSRF